MMFLILFYIQCLLVPVKIILLFTQEFNNSLFFMIILRGKNKLITKM
jgi:hypothetical protein